MKTIPNIFIGLLMTSSTVLMAAGSGDHYVVKITQMTGELEFETMEKDAIKEFEKVCNVERRYYTSAQRAAKEVWNKTAGQRDRPFPTGLSRRKISILGSRSTSSEALNKMGEHLEAQSEQAKEHRERMIKKVEDQYPIYRDMHEHDARKARQLRKERIQHLDALAAQNRNDRQQAASMIEEILTEKSGGHRTKPKEIEWTIGRSFSSEGASKTPSPASTPARSTGTTTKPANGAGVVEP